MFVALLMVGCGEEAQKEEAIDWDDNETRDKIIAEALEWGLPNRPDKELFWSDSLLEQFYLTPRKVIVKSTKRLFTGWMKHMHDNGQIKSLEQYKDGRKDGLTIEWYENGQKRKLESNFKDGKQDGLSTNWYENGQKFMEENWKDNKRDGLQTYWYENGQKKREGNFKDGKCMSAEVWKPNGEKCPVSKFVNGNGVVVLYNEDGTERSRHTYKDGERV